LRLVGQVEHKKKMKKHFKLKSLNEEINLGTIV
jgi:hypothetical protein